MLGIFLEVNKNQEITGLRSSRSLSSKSSVGGWPGFVCVLSRFSHVRLFATSGTAACQTPLPVGFCGQECWSGLLHPSPGDLLDTGIEPESLVSPALAGRFFTISTTNTFKLFLIITWLLEPSTTFNTSQLSWEFTHIRDLEVYVSSALW